MSLPGIGGSAKRRKPPRLALRGNHLGSRCSRLPFFISSTPGSRPCCSPLAGYSALRSRRRSSWL